MSKSIQYHRISIVLAIYSTCVGTHRPELQTQPTALAVHERFFEHLKPKSKPAENAPEFRPDDTDPEGDFPSTVRRGAVMKFQDFSDDDGIVVNHVKAKAYANPKEVIMGQTASFMMLGFTIFIALVLYIVNFPDPQVENYGNKLVSTSMSIYAAVLVEKIHHAFLAPCIVGPFADWFGYHSTDLGYDVLSFVFSGATFVGWFLSVSILSHFYRNSEHGLYAIQSFVAHIVAFMAIFSFGYFEKKTCSRCDNYDKGLMCYFWTSVCTFGLIWALGFLGKLIRKRLDPSTADAHSGGHHSSHEWSHVAEEAEVDARAIAVSFLCRQTVLFMITGRIPSIRGDTEPHSQHEWHFLWVCMVLTTMVLVLSTYFKERYGWGGAEGALGQGMHFSQTLLAMVFGWLLLTVVHWSAQNWMKYAACWNLITAFGVTPLTFGAIVVVDRLSDNGIVGQASELVMLNSLGITLGFAWEQAFAAGIDTVKLTFKMGFAFECAICVVMIIFVLPAWKLYIVPKAVLPIPPRVGSAGTRDEKAMGPSSSTSGGKLATASHLANVAQSMPDTH